MLQGDNRMVLGVKDGSFPLYVPYLKGSRTRKFYGTPGYSVFLANSIDKGGSSHICPDHPTQTSIVSLIQQYSCLGPVVPEQLFVAESKYYDLWERFPHTITDMYSLVTEHRHVTSSQASSRAKIVRGAISNGYKWVFVILQLDENGKGGGYKISPEIAIDFERNFPNHVSGRGPDIIAGILAHWVCCRLSSSMGCNHEHDTDAAPLQ